MGKEYALGVIEQGLESLRMSCMTLIFHDQYAALETPFSAKSDASDNGFFNFLDAKEENSFNPTDAILVRLESQLREEISKFRSMITNIALIKTVNSTRRFWNSYGVEMPILRKLFQICLSIPSSSSFIERFFSICGLVCNQRNGRSDVELIRCRSLMRANVKILQEMRYMSVNQNSFSEEE